MGATEQQIRTMIDASGLMQAACVDETIFKLCQKFITFDVLIKALLEEDFAGGTILERAITKNQNHALKYFKENFSPSQFEKELAPVLEHCRKAAEKSNNVYACELLRSNPDTKSRKKLSN